MKKYGSRFLTLIFSMLVLTSFVTPDSTKKNDPIVINFSDFQFATNDYNPDDVRVEYKKDGGKEVVNIIDNYEKILETMSVKVEAESLKENKNIFSETLLRVPDTHPYTFTRTVRYGGTSVEFNINVELYNKGSFRSINSYQGGEVKIGTSLTTTNLEGSNHNVWSPNGFPTTELYYAFNGTIVATVTSSIDSNVEADLLEAGFSFGGSVGSKTHYRRSVNSNGIVKLYD